MGIKWAPWQVSMKRRLEVLGAFIFVGIILFSELLTVLITGVVLYYGGLLLRTAFFVYLVFFFYDRNSHLNCNRGQGFEFLRGWRMWKHCSDYFPSKLIKTADLPPTKNYIFAVFPHGVISCGAFGHFVTSATNYRKLFPGIRSKLCTLSFHFYIPLFREIALGWGMMSASSSSIKYALNQPNTSTAACNQDGYTSNGVVLMVGGAQEALNARPGVYKLVVKKRKGFVKIALQTGASLVPIFSFNEVEVFDQPSNEPGSKIRKFQDIVKKYTGIAPALFIGRGFFQYSFGLIPRRHPIHTVVGAPIAVIKKESPTSQDIEEMHSKFIAALEKLFEDHKRKYLKNPEKIKLEFE